MSDSMLEDSFTHYVTSIPVILCVIVCSLFFVIFRYYADSRPDSEHILTNILLYHYSYVCQIANFFAAILIVTEIFNIESDNVISCFLYHARMIFSLLGIVYSVMITSVGTIAQIKPNLSLSIQSPVKRIGLCFFTIFGCCFIYLLITVGICGVVEICPFSNMVDCSRAIIVVIGAPVIVAQIASCGTLLVYSLFGKTGLFNTAKSQKIFDKTTQEAVKQKMTCQTSENAATTTFQKSNESKYEAGTSRTIFVVSAIPNCSVDHSLNDNKRIESKPELDVAPKDPWQPTSANHIQLTERHPTDCLKKQNNSPRTVTPTNKAENVLGVQMSSSPLIKITTYQLSFLVATVITLPYVVFCGRLPSSCILSVGPVRTLTSTTFIPFFWAVTNKKLRLFTIRKIKQLMQNDL